MTGPARVTDLVDVYVEGRLDAGEIGEGHAANLRATLRTLARVADNPPAARLRPEHVRAWLARVAAKPAWRRSRRGGEAGAAAAGLLAAGADVPRLVARTRPSPGRPV